MERSIFVSSREKCLKSKTLAGVKTFKAAEKNNGSIHL
jgi:hypothetical protein